VLVAGVLQVMVLMPALRAIGFRIRFDLPAWTPDTRRMLQLSIPVALGAAVLQTSVMLDKGISFALMQGVDQTGAAVTHFTLFGTVLAYPLEDGAVRRLDLAQLMYQFPLGIFAIALATAIFPSLSAGAVDADRAAFKRITRQGVRATLWEGLPASVGLILVADSAVRLLFQHGHTTAHDAALIAQSTRWYAAGVWAYAMLHVINRAFYALHDTRTPLIASVVNIIINMAIELPLLWVMGESGMAVGTLVSFAIQAVVMLWLLNRRVGGLGLGMLAWPVLKMIIATGLMTGVCFAVQASPVYAQGDGQFVWAQRLVVVTLVGAGVYLITTRLLNAGMREKPPVQVDKIAVN